jgi:hydrogenase/urease accessory protein HupE
VKTPCKTFVLFAALGIFSVLLHTEHAGAHKLAPSLLQITEQDQDKIEVIWKESVFKKRGGRIDPVLPDFCTPDGKPSIEKSGTGLSVRWLADCNGKSIKGSLIRVNWTGNASTCVVLRIALSDGQQIQTILTPKNPAFQVPPDQSTAQVMKSYLVLGVEHLLSGFDHMLFITGLLLLIRSRVLLLWTITAFTVGHCITLSLAALGLIHLPTAWIEFGIALSIFVLAVEVADIRGTESGASWMSRWPWAMAIAFGLLHGLGFASALGEIGLPQSDIPAALFSFNVGIELGQISWVVLLWILWALFRRLPLPSFPHWRTAVTYAIGTCAVYWCIERSLAALS